MSGPLHGGANEACVNILQNIADDGGDVAKYVNMAKDKKDNFRLMGFGHRVYKNMDPRATIIKEACDKVLKKMNVSDPLFEVDENGDLILDAEGNPIPVLITVGVGPSLNVAGANASNRFFSRFDAGGTHDDKLWKYGGKERKLKVVI